MTSHAMKSDSTAGIYAIDKSISSQRAFFLHFAIEIIIDDLNGQKCEFEKRSKFAGALEPRKPKPGDDIT